MVETLCIQKKWREPYITGVSGGTNMCQYFLPNGDPGCIIGLAFADVLPRDREFEPASYALFDLVDAESQKYVDLVQSTQDHRGTWGDAYDEAERAVERWKAYATTLAGGGL